MAKTSDFLVSHGMRHRISAKVTEKVRPIYFCVSELFKIRPVVLPLWVIEYL